MTAVVESVQTWQMRLEREAAACAGRFGRIHVIEEVDSTQDFARAENLDAGDIVVAMRQRRGRGRLHRAWEDTGADGIAATCVLEMDEPARLSIQCAVAGARAIEDVIGRAVGIKWPNDLMLNDRKVGGILVEMIDDCALAGIGINVSQTEWRAALAERTMSLLQCGHDVQRIDVIAALIRSMDRALGSDDATIISEFHSRDWLRGRRASFEHDRQEFEGIVAEIDPMKQLTVETPTGKVALPAASSRVLRVEAGR